MYFGNSRDSVGIQIADLCNYFMRRHLLKEEDEERFYEMFAGQAICAKPEPEWSTYRALLKTHDGNESGQVAEVKDDAKAKKAGTT